MNLRRKRHLAVPAAVAALALVLTACGGSGTSSSSSPQQAATSDVSDSTAVAGQVLNGTGTPTNGGTLKIAMSADPLCLDPHAISSDVEQILGHLQFDNLTYLGKDGTPTPWLATHWTISPDGKTYTFDLKKGVTFSDGTPFNAAAVVANFKHMLDPNTRSPLAGPYIAPVKSEKIINPYKLQVNLSYAYSPFLYVLAQGWLGMESPKAIADDTPAQLCAHPVGSGPFVLTKYTENVGATYVKRQGYDWGPPAIGQSGGPHLDGVDISWIGQDSVRNSGLLGGQYQLSEYVPAQDAAELKSNSNFIYEDNNRIGWPFTFDFNTSKAPLNDINVRKAIVLGVDRAQIVATASFGQYKPATSYLDDVTKFYDPSAKLPDFNRPEAEKILDQDGWKLGSDGYRTKDGKTLELSVPISNATTTSPVYELLQAQLKQIGIKLDLDLMPSTELTTKRYDGDYDLLAGVWHTNTPDVLYIKYASSQIPNSQHLGQNMAHLSDPKLDKLLQEARETTDDAKLTKLYGEAQKQLISDYPGLPIYQNSTLWAFSTKLHNVVVDTSHSTPFLTYAWLSN